MTSAKRGKSTLSPESVHITPFGLWILLEGHEYFAAFDHFPWFRDAKVQDIFNIEVPHQGHLYWPALDIDLSTESLSSPDRFPLVATTPKPRAPRS